MAALRRAQFLALLATTATLIVGCADSQRGTPGAKSGVVQNVPIEPRRLAVPKDAKPLAPAAKRREAADSERLARRLPTPFDVALTADEVVAAERTPIATNDASQLEAFPPAEKFSSTPDVVATDADSPLPWASAVEDQGRLQRGVRQADRRARQAFDLAQRGARQAARAEFIQALRLITQSLDDSRGTTHHSRSLARGLTALEEAEAFRPTGSRVEGDLELAALIAGHSTPVLKEAEAARITASAAARQYRRYAQEQLAMAAGHEPVGSLALYGLGRLHSTDTSTDTRHRAAAHFAAAALVDQRNFLAANELGVAAARAGEFQRAREALILSWQHGRQVATLRNLVLVHRELGELKLAEDAERLAHHMAKQGAASHSSSVGVRWISPSSFAETSRPALPPNRTRPAATPIAATQQNPPAAVERPRSSMSWLPWKIGTQQ